MLMMQLTMINKCGQLCQLTSADCMAASSGEKMASPCSRSSSVRGSPLKACSCGNLQHRGGGFGRGDGCVG
jgi:hypothetical protein